MTEPVLIRPAGRGVSVGIALAISYLVSGTTFLGLKLVSQDLPPVLLTTIRLWCAGLLLAPFAAWRLTRQGRWPSGQELRAAALTGLLFLTIGQTGLVWGVSVMPVGIAAVIGSAAPLFVAIFTLVFLRESISRQKLAGVLIGFAGIAVLSWNAPDGEIVPSGLAALLISAAAWAAGSLYGRTAPLPTEPIVAIDLQFLLGGMMLTPLAAIEVFNGPDIILADMDWRVAAGMAYLVVSAIAAFMAFNWLNRNISSTLANTFTYVAPVLALAIGAVFLNEALTLIKVSAAATALLGVALIVR